LRVSFASWQSQDCPTEHRDRSQIERADPDRLSFETDSPRQRCSFGIHVDEKFGGSYEVFWCNFAAYGLQDPDRHQIIVGRVRIWLPALGTHVAGQCDAAVEGLRPRLSPAEARQAPVETADLSRRTFIV